MPRPDTPDEGATPSPEGSPLPDGQLEGWKEIADYLCREVRTVQRWEEAEGLPVHRHEHQKKSTVYAYPAELDVWRRNRQPKDDPQADEDSERNRKADDGSGADPTPAPTPPVEPPPRASWKRIARWSIAVALVCFAMYGVYSLWVRPPNLPGKLRLVVLPFANLNGDAQQDYFSAGLTDEMITRLGKLDPPHLGVIAPASSNALARKPIEEIRRALDVQLVLQGSVRREGDRVRIDVQLIQASDQTHLWAESYNRELTDILGVQDQVADAVASQISSILNQKITSHLADEAVSAAPPRSVNPDAYDAFLRGRFYGTNRADLHKSIEAYQQAVQKDPNYAMAYAGLASAYALLGQVPYDDSPPAQVRPQAKAAAQHALDLDPQLAEPHAVLANLAFSYDWDFETAEREFQRALALAPNDPAVHHLYSRYFIARNRLKQARDENSHALELDPVSPLFNSVRAEIDYQAHDYDSTIDQARRSIELYPNYPLAYVWLGSAYREKKMYLQALEQFSRCRQLSGDRPAMIALYGHALGISGDAAGARQALADLERLSQSRYVSSLYFATVYLGLGQNRKALDSLDQAYREHNDRLVYLGADPIADPLRSDPRFQQLLAKIHATP